MNDKTDDDKSGRIGVPFKEVYKRYYKGYNKGFSVIWGALMITYTTFKGIVKGSFKGVYNTIRIRKYMYRDCSRNVSCYS